MRVLLISPLPPPRGGIGTWTELILSEAQRHSDIQVQVIDISPRWRKHYQMEIWRRAVGGGVQLLRDLWRALRAILRTRPDVIHLCTSGQLAFVRDIFVLGIARLLSIPSFHHIHFGRVTVLAQHAKGWEWRLGKLAFGLANTIIPIDGRTAATLREQFPAKNIIQLPNCLNPEKLNQISFSQKPGDRQPGLVRVTYIGWVIPTKGVLELVQAASRLAGQFDFELELIGPPEPTYLEEIHKAGAPLKERLLIRNELPHDQAMMALGQTDIFVLPSYTEGFPNVVMEAMALGKPVIGTDVGAIAEMIQDDQGRFCGCLVAPRDSLALEKSLRQLLGDNIGRMEMGRRAKIIFNSRYTSTVVFDQLASIWRKQNRLNSLVSGY